MGVLKHIVLPVLAVAHAYQAGRLVISGKSSIPEYYGWPDVSPLSNRELYLMGIVTSMSIALMLNCVVSIFFENSHYRGMATLLEVVFFSFEAYNAYELGYPVFIKLSFAVFAAVALMIHSMEPGVFTEDKTKKSKSS